jgi:hypothetical protein
MPLKGHCHGFSILGFLLSNNIYESLLSICLTPRKNTIEALEGFKKKKISKTYFKGVL